MKHNHLNRREFLQISVLYGAGVALAACTPDLTDFSERQTDTLRSLTILYTNDEHGWMERTEQYGGAAGMLHQWRRLAGYTQDGTFLVLSGGDMWTGPALSTWFKGESMIDVMNLMGYTAAAIGNHDFDFGVEVLQQRAAQANFPFLSANIREKATGKTPDFLRPYVIQEINGLKVGLIGLTTLDTPVDTNPANVAEFDFLPYKATLREAVPKAKADGAQLIVLLGHLCSGEMRSLASLANELGIQILCAGHCHEEIVEQVGEETIVESGSFLHKSVHIAALFDTGLNSLVDVDAILLDNPSGSGDTTIDKLVQSWHGRADPELWQVIGTVGKKIDAGTAEMAKLLTIPWLEAYPSAKIALFSPRYVQSLPAGDVSEGSILSMLPTDNVLVDIQLTGAQILEVLDKRHPSVGGLSEVEGKYILSDGTPLEPLTSYHVLIPDSLYEGENNFDARRYDPNGTYTGIDWRTPVVSWVRRLNTSDETRLEFYLSP
jgi:5'-nucleotidase/UDP-sugar diphosphatase